jgi:hypothetical protein
MELKLKTRRNEKGFILFLAVAMIPLAGVALLLLSGGTRMMADEERSTRRQTAREDLFASTAAWASHNRNHLAAALVGVAQPLDLTEFGLKYAACSVTLDRVAEGEIHLTILARVDEHARPRSKQLTLKVEGLVAPPAIVDTVGHDPNTVPVAMPATDQPLLPQPGEPNDVLRDPNAVR